MAKSPKKIKGKTRPDANTTPRKRKARAPRVNLEHYKKAGFEIKNKKLVWTNEKLHFDKFYASEGLSSYYRATFFGGVVNVQLIPLESLPDFLENLIEMENDYGAFYDKITLREGDRNMHGQSAGFSTMSDTAEELLLKLNQYKRHGALIGDGGSFEYIQVCFINFK